jgi:hypothetical protein
MSRERELLKELHRAVDCEWLDEIEAVLAEPEQKPLSEDKLDVLAEANITDEGIAGYYLGFRDAEKAHGIGGE